MNFIIIILIDKYEQLELNDVSLNMDDLFP